MWVKVFVKMKVETFELGPIGTNAYWVSDQESAFLIDAPHTAWDRVQKCNVKPLALILTHGHWDHIADAWRFHKAGVPIYAHKGDKDWIENPGPMNAMLPPQLHFPGTQVDHWVEQGDVLTFLGLNFEVRHVPGHAPGNIVLYNELEKVAFVGDVIFSGSVGRYDLPGGNADILRESIRSQIYSLPDETVLYSGHGPTTTVGKEKRTNPFVRA